MDLHRLNSFFGVPSTFEVAPLLKSKPLDFESLKSEVLAHEEGLSRPLVEHLKTSSRVSMESMQWVTSRFILLGQIKKFILAHLSLDRALVSISHTPDFAGVLLVPSGVQGIGLDMEDRERAISSAAETRYTLEQEKQLPFTALERWVIKEAAFKAVENYLGRPETHIVTQIEIINESEARVSDFSVDYFLSDHQNLKVALAKLRG